jgi:glycosyltransferase involved in cell wall biosynthesis
MLTQVDEVIVADNGSTDGTRDILAQLPVRIVDDPDVAYYQSRKMSALAALAHTAGADWVVPFDADEIWTSQWGRLADILEQHSPDYGLVTATLYDHVATGVDEPEDDPVRRILWRRRNPLELCKVAARTADGLVIEQGNHWARHPIPARFTDKPALLVHHFPYRSVDQLIRKVRNGAQAYAATSGLPEQAGAHWRQWGDLSDEQIGDLFRKWYWRADPRCDVTIDGEYQHALIRDPAPLP